MGKGAMDEAVLLDIKGSLRSVVISCSAGLVMLAPLILFTVDIMIKRVLGGDK